MSEQTMQQSTESNTLDDERRRFFRIDDSVHMSLRIVPEDELEKRLRLLDRDTDTGFSLMTGLGAIAQQVATTLRRIEAKDADVAEYLKAMDRKLELVARALVAQEVDVADQPAFAVNLSGGGMAVHSRVAMNEGALLEIKLLLRPSYAGILTYGTVVDCRTLADEEVDPEYPYLLRIDFSFMREIDRDALIRHVMLKQSEWLRERRARREKGGAE